MSKGLADDGDDYDDDDALRPKYPPTRQPENFHQSTFFEDFCHMFWRLSLYRLKGSRMTTKYDRQAKFGAYEAIECLKGPRMTKKI